MAFNNLSYNNKAADISDLESLLSCSSEISSSVLPRYVFPPFPPRKQEERTRKKGFLRDFYNTKQHTLSH